VKETRSPAHVAGMVESTGDARPVGVRSAFWMTQTPDGRMAELDHLRIVAAGASHLGLIRGQNEDRFLVAPPLFAVADGMGGHPGGDLAAATAVEALERGVRAIEAGQTSLLDLMAATNRAVYEAGSRAGLPGLGTTLTVLFADGVRAEVAHVGDSRAYLWRDLALVRLTEDHTIVRQLIRAGQLSEEQASKHPSRSTLARAVGPDEGVLIDHLTIRLRAGDVLLLCTDGLTSMVSESEIGAILAREPAPRSACDLLVEAAVSAGGRDNVTAIVAEVGSPPG